MKKTFSVYQRRDGRFEGRIPDGKKEDGKRKFRYVLARSREQVIEKMAEICDGYKTESCAKTVAEVYTEYHNSIRYRVKESTAANYMMKAKNHIIPVLGSKQIDSVTEEEVYCFIQEKQNAGLSARYIADIVILMKALFKYAVRIYHIFNPMASITLPKKKSPEIQLLDEQEQQRLQRYIAENQNKSTLGVALSMSTGIRIGELCALQWKDVDLEKRILTVRKTLQRIQRPTETARTKLIITEPKSESSKRSIPIPECMIEFLKKFKGNSDEYLLSGSKQPTEPRTMQYRFARILKNVNLPSVHFHALRHMFASKCIRLGFDIKALSELLGHSSVEITLNRYVHSSFEEKKNLMGRLSFSF